MAVPGTKLSTSLARMSATDRIALALTASLLLATACGNGTTTADLALGGPTPQRGGTLRYALSSDPPSVTPLGVGDDQSGLLVVRNVFAGLVDVDPSTLATVPAIASSWTPSADGRTWTFRLRTDARFQHGLGPVTASTFVRDWSLLCSPAVGAPHAWILAPVAGYDRCRQGGGLSGVRAQGDHALVVHLSQPYRGFAASLADPATWAFPPDLNTTAAGRAAFDDSPAGAGAFQITSRTRRDFGPGHAPIPGELVLERFPGYFGRPALVDRVDMPVVDPGNPAAAFSRYRSGQLDVLAVAPTLVDAVRADPRFSQQLIGYPLLELIALEPARATPPPSAATVARSLNPAAVVTQAFGKAGQTADGVVPAGTPGYVPLSEPPLPAAGPPPALVSVTVTTPSDAALRPIADAVVANLRKSGMRARLAAAGSYRVADVRAQYAAADAFLAQLGGSPEQVLLAESRAAADPAAASDDRLAAQRLLQRRGAVMPIAFGETQLLVSPRVRGVVNDGLGAVPLRTLWLARGG